MDGAKHWVMAAGFDLLSKMELYTFSVSPVSFMLGDSILFPVFIEKLKTFPEKDKDWYSDSMSSFSQGEYYTSLKIKLMEKNVPEE